MLFLGSKVTLLESSVLAILNLRLTMSSNNNLSPSARSVSSRRSQTSRRSASSRNWQPPAVRPIGGGGGRKSSRSSSRSLASRANDPSSITIGTSLIAFHNDDSFKSVCGVSCGDGTAFCVKKNCAIASHKEKKRIPGLKPGVYVKSKDSQRTKEAFVHPVGELELFDKHKKALMSTSSKDLSFW